MPELVGREPELAKIDIALERARSGLAIVRVEGEPGIGKSEVVRAAIDRARSRGFEVLHSRPSAAEASLAFASLSDLLEPIVDRSMHGLPEPQRVAIEVALLRHAGDGPVAPRAAAAGTLSVLRHAAERGPLLVAVDDVQWLDAASAGAMVFAFRRLVDAHVAILLAGRPADGSTDPLGEVNALGPDRVTWLTVGPLSLSATYHLLRVQELSPPSRPALRRLYDATRGNPLYAIELARAIRDRPGPLDTLDPLPVPESMRTLLSRRVASRRSEARTAMLAVALAGAPTEAMLRAIDRRAAAQVDDLVAGGILDRRQARLEFTHPLLAEVTLASFDEEERRRMHRRLAEIADEPERRARHRALAADGPDPSVAEELVVAAAASARTSPEVACELLELAIEATPEAERERRRERSLQLARWSIRAGDTRGAIAVLDGLLVAAEPGWFRARVLELRAQVDWVAGRLADAIDRCQEALACPGLDPWTRARIAVTRARITLEPKEAERLATDALEQLDGLPEPDLALRGEALTALAGAQVYLGSSIDEALIEEALRLEAVAPPEAVSERFSAALGAYLKYQGRLEEARTWLRRTKEAAIAEGDEGSLPYALSHLPQLELWTGDWTAAEDAAREHLAVAEWTGQEEQRLTANYSLALVDAYAGRLQQARDRIAENLTAAERVDDWNVYQLLGVLGFVELSAGRHHEALPALLRAHAIYEAYGAGNVVAVHEDLAETLVEAADLVAAEDMIATYVDRATLLQRPSGLAASARSLALLRAAQGRMDDALSAVDVALDHERRAHVPFSRARTLLVAGRLRRRVGERRAARDALDEALRIFTSLGAATWAEKARLERSRLALRPAVGHDELTPTERRVAELVGRGLTNREVAGQLFVTTKTVEANLTRIYAKLAVRSRAELAAMLREKGLQPAEL